MITQPIDGLATTTGTSETIALNKISGKDEFAVQVTISSSASVSVQGRLSADAPWVELVALTTNAIQILALMGQVRFVVTSNTGTVDVHMRY